MTFYSFYSFGPNGSIDIWGFDARAALGSYGNRVNYDIDIGTVIRIANRVTLPEPGTVILLSLGLAGLSFARYGKQS